MAASKGAARKGATRAVQVEVPSLPHGLRRDGGWVDRAEMDLGSPDKAEQQAAVAILDHLARAVPRPPWEDWSSAQRSVEEACLQDPQAILGLGRPPGEVSGSTGYHDALRAAGPTDKWHQEWFAVAEHHGRDRIARLVFAWLGTAPSSGTGSLNRPGPNRDLLYALCFAAAALGNGAVDPLRRLAAHATEARTFQAPTAAVTLGLVGSEAALAALEQLASSVKRPTPKTRFRRVSEALQARLGLDAAAAAERFVPTLGLDAEGRRQLVTEVGSAELSVGPDGAVTLTWRAANGKQTRSAPAALKAQHATALRDLATTAKAITSQLATQRQRLDRMMEAVTHQSWPAADWARWYLGHVLVAPIARRLIWTFDGVAALPDSTGVPRTVTGEPVPLTSGTTVALWHPLGRPVSEVAGWRGHLLDLGITQPFRQAYREVYPLTDAERVTATYSTRFAAHVLRQHQYKELALGRGWSAELMHSGGSERKTATRTLPRFGLTAELWTYPPPGDDWETTPAGMLLHIGTDRVCFRRAEPEGAYVRLADVPPLALSEVMRDVDLFVGVASVGNDPTWYDDGHAGRYRTYCQSYSFGELSATAQIRREVLERLVPRLKIAGQCTVLDRFLVVRGQLRTYKIHLGSGNILMEPNAQYLCIVPARGSANTDNVFLPFEGDTLLSIILSKAFLLAADDQITDPSITRQLARS